MEHIDHFRYFNFEFCPFPQINCGKSYKIAIKMQKKKRSAPPPPPHSSILIKRADTLVPEVYGVVIARIELPSKELNAKNS